MKFNVFAFATVVAVSAMAASSNKYKESTSNTEVLSYLLKIQAKERAVAASAPQGCHWEGTSPFCAANGCPHGYTEHGRSACGDGACCVTGWKVLCCMDDD